MDLSIDTMRIYLVNHRQSCAALVMLLLKWSFYCQNWKKHTQISHKAEHLWPPKVYNIIHSCHSYGCAKLQQEECSIGGAILQTEDCMLRLTSHDLPCRPDKIQKFGDGVGAAIYYNSCSSKYINRPMNENYMQIQLK